MSIGKLFFVSSRFFLILATISILFVFINYAFSPKDLRVFFCNQLSNHLKTKIANEVKQVLNQKLSAQNINSKIKEFFSALSEVSVRYNASGFADVYIKGQRPYILFGGDKNYFVLTKEGTVSDPKNYNPQSLDFLNFIKAGANQLNNKELVSFASSLDQNIFENFSVNWNSKNEIILNSLDRKNFQIITDYQSINQPKKLEFAEKIYSKKNKGKKIRVDIRFKDLVICS